MIEDGSEMVMWIDSTNGEDRVMFKAKQAGGTVTTGTVPLT